MKTLIAVLAASFAISPITFSHRACKGILPPNDMYIPITIKQDGGITEKDFNTVLDRIEAYFTPVFDKVGAELNVARRWEDGTVNAYADQRGDIWSITMYGGLARHPAITKDGFALVACHEIGHHIGGAPKYRYMGWATNEGAADYYATLKCMREIFGNDDNEKIVQELNPDAYLVEHCQQLHSETAEQALCMRAGMAGKSLAMLFWDFDQGELPNFATPDPAEVDETDDQHPATQCRLDTYYAGSICTVPVTDSVSQRDPRPGSCYGDSFAQRSLRPRCWFKPL